MGVPNTHTPIVNAKGFKSRPGVGAENRLVGQDFPTIPKTVALAEVGFGPHYNLIGVLLKAPGFAVDFPAECGVGSIDAQWQTLVFACGIVNGEGRQDEYAQK